MLRIIPGQNAQGIDPDLLNAIFGFLMQQKITPEQVKAAKATPEGRRLAQEFTDVLALIDSAYTLNYPQILNHTKSVLDLLKADLQTLHEHITCPEESPTNSKVSSQLNLDMEYLGDIADLKESSEEVTTKLENIVKATSTLRAHQQSFSLFARNYKGLQSAAAADDVLEATRELRLTSFSR